MNKLNEYSPVPDTFDNVDFRDRVVGSSRPSQDGINPALLQDIQIAAKKAGIKVDITTAISGHDLSKPTRHATGNAVDIAIINGKAVSSSNRKDAEKLVDELVKMGYTKNKEVGNPKAVLTFGFPNHDDHVHVSNTTNTPTEIEDTKIGQSETGFETSLTSPSGYKFKDPILANIMSGMDFITGLNEIKNDLLDEYDYLLENKDYDDFGKNTYVAGKELVIPSNNNSKIKSPVSGEIDSLTYNSSCKNQLVIKFKTNKKIYYLEYCGIDTVYLNRGSKVNQGTKIGETNSNVTVSLYDSSGQKTYMDEILNKTSDDGNNKKKDIDSKQRFHDPMLAGLIGLPGKVLNRVWSSPTEKNQPSSWSAKWNPTKKVNEDIERIKKLL